jgi:YVTN family beta-propeller protein
VGSDPLAGAFSASGDLYVPNHGSSTVSVVSQAGGSLTVKATIPVDGHPIAAAADGAGNVYVPMGDNWSGKIDVISGTSVTSTNTMKELALFLRDVAADTSTHNAFVLDGTGRLFMFHGTQLLSWINLNQPAEHVVVDSATHSVYVSELRGGTESAIQQVLVSGNTMSVGGVLTSTSGDPTNNDGFDGLATSPVTHTLYASHQFTNKVDVIDTTKMTVERQNTAAGLAVTGLSYSKTNDSVFAVAGNSITQMNAAGEIDDASLSTESINSAGGVTFSPAGAPYISNDQTNAVDVFDLSPQLTGFELNGVASTTIPRTTAPVQLIGRNIGHATKVTINGTPVTKIQTINSSTIEATPAGEVLEAWNGTPLTIAVSTPWGDVAPVNNLFSISNSPDTVVPLHLSIGAGSTQQRSLVCADPTPYLTNYVQDVDEVETGGVTPTVMTGVEIDQLGSWQPLIMDNASYTYANDGYPNGVDLTVRNAAISGSNDFNANAHCTNDPNEVWSAKLGTASTLDGPIAKSDTTGYTQVVIPNKSSSDLRITRIYIDDQWSYISGIMDWDPAQPEWWSYPSIWKVDNSVDLPHVGEIVKAGTQISLWLRQDSTNFGEVVHVNLTDGHGNNVDVSYMPFGTVGIVTGDEYGCDVLGGTGLACLHNTGGTHLSDASHAGVVDPGAGN